jgi:hypothetical protein
MHERGERLECSSRMQATRARTQGLPSMRALREADLGCGSTVAWSRADQSLITAPNCGTDGTGNSKVSFWPEPSSME